MARISPHKLTNMSSLGRVMAGLGRRRPLVGLLVLLLVVAGVAVIAGVQARQTSAASVTPRYNVVQVVIDDMAYTDLNPTAMPFTSSFPNMQWFTGVHNEVAQCCQDRSTMFTGLTTYHTGVQNTTGPHDGRVMADTNTLPVWLSKAGYRTALIGKYLNGYGPGGTFRQDCSVPPGWTRWQAYTTPPGYGTAADPYTLCLKSSGQTAKRTDYAVDYLASQSAAFLKTQAKAGTHFYLDYAPYAPHFGGTGEPIPPTRYAHTFDTATVPKGPDYLNKADAPAYIQSRPLLSDATMTNEVHLRWGALRAVDDGIKTLYNTLVSTGQINNTVVIVVSDNGWGAGAHNWREKLCEFEECNHLAMGIYVPGQAGGSHDGLVAPQDITATMAALAKVTPGRTIDGKSFASSLTGGADPARADMEFHWIGGGNTCCNSIPERFHGVMTADGWKYVELGTGEHEMYYLKNDPFELTNLYGNPTYASQQSYLANRLAQISPPLGTSAQQAVQDPAFQSD